MPTIKKWELDRIAYKIDELEVEIRRQLGLDKISGGFVSIHFNGYDNDLIHIIVTDGVQSDCENRVNTWETSLNRKTLKMKDE